MLNSRTPSLFVLFLLLLLPLPSTPTTLYVTPTPYTPCPAHPCHTLSQYVENATEYFTSNTTMIFLLGEHILKTQANVTNVTGFSMVGESENTSRIVCRGSDCGGFYFENVWHLNITYLSFVSDSHSITAVYVDDLQLVNCTFANSSDTALITHDSNLLLDGNTFVNNSGGRASQMTFTPGGGIAAVFSNISFQGTNTFMNNTCEADVCGGGAMYADNSIVTFLDGNTSFISNQANSKNLYSTLPGGGGMYVLNTAITITGYVDFINNRVSSSVTVAHKNTCGGGGASLLYCNASISGRVIFSNNLVNGESADLGGGIIFMYSNVDISGTVLLINNSAPYDGGGMLVSFSHVSIYGVVSLTNNSAGQDGGGIAVFNGTVDIMNIGSVLLNDNYAGYLGGGIYVQGSSLHIAGMVSLTNNSAGGGGGIFGFHSSVDIMKFGSVLLTDNYAGIDGGGMYVQYNSSLHIAGMVSLTNNSASKDGGGIYVSGGSVDIMKIGFVLLTDNYAGEEGGGIYVSGGSVDIMKIGFVLLTDNYAGLEGGGMYVEGSSLHIAGMVSLTGNKVGRLSGGGIYLHNSNLDVTGSVSVTENYAIQGAGMHVVNSSLHIIAGEMSFINNAVPGFGGGMLVADSHVGISGVVSLTNNSADQAGGGIAVFNSIITGSVFLTDNCAGSNGAGIDTALNSQSSTTVYFSDNRAQHGGAIYVHDMSPLVYCASDVGAQCVIEDCFFQIPNTSVGLGNLFMFEGNVAESGSVMYGGSVDRCRLEGYPEAHSGEVFDMIANYSQQPGTLVLISSDAFQVCLCENNQPNCSYSIKVTAYSGETFSITVTTVGQRNGAVSALVNSITNPIQNSRLGAFEDHQQVHGSCTQLHYTYYSRESNNTLLMYVDGSCSSLDGSVNRLTIPVYLLPCPPAFTLSESTDGCVCEERLQKYTDKCNINDLTILRDGDFWVGYDSQSQGLILHPHCPFDYCKTISIHFTLNGTDLQCEYDRTGLLCGACQADLSLALGSSQCLPCSNFFLFLLLLFAVMGLALVLFLFTCKLTVAVGTISGLVFYANIVGANRSIFFPSGNHLEVFIAWINLDLGIETCFYEGMDAYVKTWLQFAFPIYIWAIVGLIIFISGRSPRISRMLGSNPVAVLATLILLSYAKILRTIISALSFTTLQYPNDETRVVWLYDANIRYLHGKHIPLFVVGLLFLVFLFLPYTLLLLLGQWLQAFSHLKVLSWMNNQKLKAFLDAYHAPYTGKHRYWPGLLLVLRFALLLVFGSNALGDNSENLLVILSASFGLLLWPWIVGNVYENWYINTLEASYIFNLGVLAVATNYVRQSGGNQAAVAYTSTGIAFATFIATVFYHIYLQTKGSRFWRVLCCRKDNRQDNERDGLYEDSGNKPLVAPSTTYVSYGSCAQLREPLLDTHENEHEIIAN